MKTIYKLTILLIAFPFFLNAQSGISLCCLEAENMVDPPNVYSYSIDPNSLAVEETVVYNIYFWGINRDDGTSDHPLTEEEVLQIVANLNINYNPFKIFFKYFGIDFINATEIYHPFTYQEIDDYAIANEKIKIKSFNMYVFNDSDNASFDGLGRLHNTFSYVRSDLVDGPLPVHLLGHNFNLANTFRNSGAIDEDDCEHVTRILDDPNFNADEKGDLVVDTAAQPPFINSNGSTDDDFDEEDCFYLGGGDDCQGTPYEIEPEDVQNFMSYTHDNYLCLNNFSDGQGIRMRDAIDNDPQGRYVLAETSEASLYAPYKGLYYFAGPILPEHTPLFQPGFEYRFVECNGPYPQPAIYDAVFDYDENNILSLIDTYESNFGTITHPNHSAIIISQLDVANNNLQVQKCYDNFNLSPSGGVIIKFNDNVFNTNVTITPQDSTSINNQNLIEELPSGLYNVQKVYDNGTTEETVIFKENN